MVINVTAVMHCNQCFCFIFELNRVLSFYLCKTSMMMNASSDLLTCDMIKGNELDVRNIEFELQIKR